MFFGAGPAYFVILFLGIVLFYATLAAHIFWCIRLAFSPAVAGRPRLQRIAILTAAFLLPVISFYAVHIACWWSDVRGKLTVRAFLPLTLVILATLATSVFLTIRFELRGPQSYRGWSDMLEEVTDRSLFLAVLQILLFMILRTASPSWRKAHVFGAAIVLIPLLIFT